MVEENSENMQNFVEESNPEEPGEKQEIQRDGMGRFVPGVSGNPSGGDGRPVGSVSLAKIIKKKLSEIPAGQNMTIAEILASRMLKKALDGDFQMQKLVWSYVDGVPKLESKETQEEVLPKDPVPTSTPETKATIKRIVEISAELERMEFERKNGRPL